MQYITKNVDFIHCDDFVYKNNIVLCGDKNYIKYAGITLTSILVNSNSNEYHFHIFIDYISDGDLEKLKVTAEKYKTNISIYFIDVKTVSQFLENTSQNTHITVAAYFRLVAFGALKGIVDNALYLDSDICVLDDKLKNVFDVTFDDAVAYTICDIKSSVMGGRTHVAKYFNSGVIFVNIVKWNNLDLTPACIKEASEKVYPYLDQDILNIYLDGKCKYLPSRYNNQYSLSRLIDESDIPSKVKFDRESTTVLHYIGASKPWHTWVQCCAAAKLYIEVKNKSEWANISLSGPESKTKQTYKYWHKAARVAKKEGQYGDMLKFYIKYAVSKMIK